MVLSYAWLLLLVIQVTTCYGAHREAELPMQLCCMAMQRSCMGPGSFRLSAAISTTTNSDNSDITNNSNLSTNIKNINTITSST